MATLTVWKFSNADGAEEAVRTLSSLTSQELINVHDAATASWPEGKKKPKTRQANDLTSSGAFGGAFWGLLFGMIFFVPLLGAAVGAATGALSGALSDAGIDDGFINRVRDQLTEGTSALFLLSSDAVVDRVKDAFAGSDMELISTNLSAEEEAALRAAFAEEE
ncbi:DUF1269 domain-containing protein [Nocardioides panacisoli]|uniref:DUF1269 domain-containing protein n=1 Tax=Nocardioides panacisoli TaxID=627624 RepID=UPI001C62C442|nr:DUF1269 domain-containing protein [Nocardioides panacisoli]QYJ04836.1 DUF1269 domain-containing protein [Nocardioides panacisoli]